MKNSFTGGFVFLVLCFLGGTVVSAKEPAHLIYIGHDKVAAAFAQGLPLLRTNHFKVQTGRRVAPGEVEIHKRDTDIFYVLEGSGTLVTGGKAVEVRTIARHELRATRIEGGESRHIQKGDVLIIPKGVPHWFKEVNGPLLYYVVKVTE